MRTNLTCLATLAAACAIAGLPFGATAAASSASCYEYNCADVISPPVLGIPCYDLDADYSCDGSSQPGQPGHAEPGQPGQGGGQPGQPGHAEPGQPGQSVSRSGSESDASADSVARPVAFSVAGLILAGGAVAYFVRRCKS
jgi:hypothetical protein